MKILVMSDSHSALSFMRLCISKLKPDVLIHLGDYYDDGQAMAEEYSGLRFYQVPGNCDRYRCPPDVPEILLIEADGVRLYLTHGHKHRVKQTIFTLLRDARAARAAAVLYGHTHVPNCYRDQDGLWVLNPGSCGYFGGTVGLIETKNGEIVECRIIRQEDLS